MSLFLQQIATQWPMLHNCLTTSSLDPRDPDSPALAELMSAVNEQTPVKTGMTEFCNHLELSLTNYETQITDELATTKKENADLKSTVINLQQQLLQNPQFARDARSAQKPPTSKITPFTGEEPSKKRQDMFETWLSAVQLRLLEHEDYYDTPFKRISVVLEHLNGFAKDALNPGIKLLINNPHSPGQWLWPDAQELLAKLSKLYIIIDSQAEAQRELEALYQKDSPFNDFVTKLVRLADRAGYGDIQKIILLRQKISNNLQDLLVTVTPAGRPKAGSDSEFNDWVELLQGLSSNLDYRRHQAKLQGGQYNGRTTFTIPMPPTNTATTTANPDAMIIDAMRTTRLTDEERARRRANNLCMYCGGSGHFARECTEKTNPTRGRGRGGLRGGRPSYTQGYPPPYQQTQQRPQTQLRQAELPAPVLQNKPFRPSTAPATPTPTEASYVTDRITPLDDDAQTTSSDWQLQPKA